MYKNELEELLEKMIDSGMDMAQYKRNPTKLIVPPYLMQAAENIFKSPLTNKHEIKVDFDE